MLDFINKWYNEGDKKKGIKAFKDLGSLDFWIDN